MFLNHLLLIIFTIFIIKKLCKNLNSIENSQFKYLICIYAGI